MTTKSCHHTCLDCVFHTMHADLGCRIHLCILPPDCAPPIQHDEGADEWRDREADGRTYLGTSCDVMRRMGAACGPHAAMWLDAHAAPTEGRHA